MNNERQPLHAHDRFQSGDLYEPYVGRWSRLVAQQFLEWLAAPPGKRWLDVGSGTGALSETILEMSNPTEILGIDRSEGFVQHAQSRNTDSRVQFRVGDAQDLRVEPGTFDVIVSGLVLNFVPKPEVMVSEMAQAAKAGGLVAAYVWDYAGKMQFMRHFWNAAAALDSHALELDEGRRFPLNQPEPLKQLFEATGLRKVQARAIEIATHFADWDDFWSPFLGGQGPAPAYVLSLAPERRAALEERLRASVPFALDGSIPLVARAWAVRANKQ